MSSNITIRDGQYYSVGAYTVDIAAFAAGGLVEGTGYTESVSLSELLAPDDMVFSWSWPTFPLAFIHSFLSVQYGDYDNGDPQFPIASTRLGDLRTLSENAVFSMSGNTAGCDVITDIFLTNKAGGTNAHADEVEVFFSTPAYSQNWMDTLTDVGSVFGSGTDWDVYKATENGIPDYVIAPSNDATITGNVDLVGLLQYLVSGGHLSDSLYFNGLAFGVETESGAGSMNLNSYSVSYSTQATLPLISIGLRNPSGSVTAGQFYTTAVMLSGQAEAGASVAIYKGSSLLGNATATSSGSWTYNPGSLSNGYNNLTATETDAYGNSASASVEIQLNTVALSLSEFVAYVVGQGDDGVYTKIPTLEGWTAPNAAVALANNGTYLGEITASSSGFYSFTPKSLTNGLNDLVASASDIYGRMTTTSNSLLYYAANKTQYPSIPTVSLGLEHATGSLVGAKWYTTNAELDGDATAGDKVTVFDSTTDIGTTTANASGVWSFAPSGLANGYHDLVAKVTASDGLTAVSSMVIMLNNNAMNLSEKISSTAGQGSLGVYTVDPTLNGWTTPSANVYLSDGANYLNEVNANSSGYWSYQTQGLASGEHDFVASARDQYGRFANKAVSFMYE